MVKGLRKNLYKAFLLEPDGNKEAFLRKIMQDLYTDIETSRQVKLRPTLSQRLDTAKTLVGKTFTHTRDGHAATFTITPDAKFADPVGVKHARATRAIHDQHRINPAVRNPVNNAWKDAVDEFGKSIDDYWRENQKKP